MTQRPRVLVIGLDGFEKSFCDALMADGALPALAALRGRSANLLLDHGPAVRTGLAWEHFWSGWSPDAAGRASAVEFDPATYAVWQEGARFGPFFGPLDVRSVVLDPPYVDFRFAPGVNGVVGWGAHDPGVLSSMAAPDGLLADMTSKIGPYPAARWTYGLPWPSPDATKAMGDGLVAGVEARDAAARWLLAERFRDWDLALVVVAEPHSAAEAMWHGVDADHPLHEHPSAGPAAAALADVYLATDRLIGNLVDAADATAVVVFAMHGMGANRSDVQSMLLLPELVYRWALGERLLEVPPAWTSATDRVPLVDCDQATWRSLAPSSPMHQSSAGIRALVEHLPPPVARWIRHTRAERRARARPSGYQSLSWQPTTWYQPRWREMRAFALPSFYDGRIRVNLRGREVDGMVAPGDYERMCDELEALVRALVDPRTGDPVVAAVERVEPGRDPLALDSSAADLVVVWRDSSVAFEHPVHGLVGPVNYRRTGGHTGPYGFASVAAPSVVAGEYGIASSFDVSPTIIDLLGSPPIDGVSGESLMGVLRGVPTVG